MAFLPACLESISQNPPALDYEVVVVDNCSSDGSREWLQSNEARDIFNGNQLRVILNENNVGFGKANNQVMDTSESKYFFVLNPDTVIKPKAIDLLVEALESKEDIGAVSPKLLNDDGSLQPSVTHFPPTPLSILLTASGMIKVLPKNLLGSLIYNEYWSHDERSAVPVFWGTAIMVKREVVREIGGFDPDFYMYGEDVEWCYRMNKNGWKTVFVPESEVVHFGGKSSEQAWKQSETYLRKEQADILVQKKALSPYKVGLNSLTKGLVYLLAYIKKSALRQKKDFLLPHISLQFETCVKSIKSVRNFRHKN